MTKEIILKNEQIIKLVDEIDVYPNKLNSTLKKLYPEVYSEILSCTNFLDSQKYYQSRPVPILARLYCIRHNINSPILCENPNCSNPTEWRSKRQAFAPYCCCQCEYTDPNFVKKVETSTLKTHGVRNAMQSSIIRKKAQETHFQHYGTYSMGWGEDAMMKREQTLLEHYDVKHQSQSPIVQNKIKETFYRNYNTTHPLKSPEILRKLEETNLHKYGVKQIFSSPYFRRKIQETLLRKYKATNYILSEEYRKRLPEILLKTKNTVRQRYGVDNVSQDIEINKRIHRKFRSEMFPDMTFDSTWEVKVYEFCMSNGIAIEYQPTISFKYIYDGKQHVYHPDFLINGKVYEVKGEQFFRFNNSTGKEEMCCHPFNKKHLTQEEYEKECGRAESKHQCMLANGVELIRKKQLNNLGELFDKVVDIDI